MSRTYSWLTYSSARTQLAQSLGDSSSVFFLNTGTYNEIGLCVKEALRTWQCLTGYWRGRDSFTASAGNTFYDLSSVLNNGLRSYNVYDTDLCASMQYRLSENLGSEAPGDTWIGTSMFSLEQLTDALQTRRDSFLEQTGIILGTSTLTVSPPAPSYGFADDTVIDVRRMAWIDPVTGKKSYLHRQDEWQMNAYNPGWNAGFGGAPSSYSLASTPVLNFALSPTPGVGSSVELITTNSGATLNPAAGVLIGVPDDWAWVVEFGALADLLSEDGPSPDVQLSEYCEARWQQGIALARLAPCVVAAKINGADVMPTPLWDMDMYNPGWENSTSGTNQLAFAGQNLVAISPPPSASSTPSILVDVVQNAPMPASDGAYIQIGREEWSAILDYSQHLASLKLSADEFKGTLGLYKNFMQQAALYNDRLAAYAPMFKPMALQMHTECEKIQRRLSDSMVEVGSGTTKGGE